MSDLPNVSDTPGKPAPWNDPKIRALVFQALLIGVVVMFGYYLVSNTLHNMEQRGISTGFDFLDNTAGFGVTQSLIEYDETHTYGPTSRSFATSRCCCRSSSGTSPLASTCRDRSRASPWARRSFSTTVACSSRARSPRTASGW